jgi:hypothetical protein
VTVKGDFSPRGNVHTVVEVCHQRWLAIPGAIANWPPQDVL